MACLRAHRPAVRLFAIIVTAGALAACAQSSVATKSALRLSGRWISSLRSKNAAATARTRATLARRHVPSGNRHAVAPTATSYGLASYYRYDSLTASGEKFDPHKLTAAHRTAPFGTRLRVTDVATGRSVTVRVNDRGPFVPGRVVDLSYAAAEALGIVRRGVARVKVAVVRQ